jgi:hypothetical protein
MGWPLVFFLRGWERAGKLKTGERRMAGRDTRRKQVSRGERYVPGPAELERALGKLLPIAASLLADSGDLQVLDETWVRDHVGIRSTQPDNGAKRR